MKKILLFSCMLIMQLSAEHSWSTCQKENCAACSDYSACNDRDEPSIKDTFDIEGEKRCSRKGCNADSSEYRTGLEA